MPKQRSKDDSRKKPRVRAKNATSRGPQSVEIVALIKLTDDRKKLAGKIARKASWLEATEEEPRFQKRTSAARRSSMMAIRPVNDAAAKTVADRLGVLGKCIVASRPDDVLGHLERLVMYSYLRNPGSTRETQALLGSPCLDSVNPDAELLRLALRAELPVDPLQSNRVEYGGVFGFVEHFLPSPLLGALGEISRAWVDEYPLNRLSLDLITAFVAAFDSRLILDAHPEETRLGASAVDVVETHRLLLSYAKDLQALFLVSVPQKEAKHQGLPPLNITICKDARGSIDIITNGKNKPESLAAKRTVIAIALLERRERHFTSAEFCRLFTGEETRNSAARFGDNLRKAGLYGYRVGERAYSFPNLHFTMEGVTIDELERFVKDHWNDALKLKLVQSGKWKTPLVY